MFEKLPSWLEKKIAEAREKLPVRNNTDVIPGVIHLEKGRLCLKVTV